MTLRRGRGCLMADDGTTAATLVSVSGDGAGAETGIGEACSPCESEPEVTVADAEGLVGEAKVVASGLALFFCRNLGRGCEMPLPFPFVGDCLEFR